MINVALLNYWLTIDFSSDYPEIREMIVLGTAVTVNHRFSD
jgi:hypothetical protein